MELAFYTTIKNAYNCEHDKYEIRMIENNKKIFPLLSQNWTLFSDVDLNTVFVFYVFTSKKIPQCAVK